MYLSLVSLLAWLVLVLPKIVAPSSTVPYSSTLFFLEKQILCMFLKIDDWKSKVTIHCVSIIVICIYVYVHELFLYLVCEQCFCVYLCMNNLLMVSIWNLLFITKTMNFFIYDEIYCCSWINFEFGIGKFEIKPAGC